MTDHERVGLLEAARDDLAEVEMAMVAVNLSHPGARDELVPAMLKLDGAVETLTRAIGAQALPPSRSGVRELAEGGQR